MRNTLIMVVASALLLGAGPAAAHAFLDHAQPAVGATVAVAPSEVSIWFTEALEPAFSAITVTDATGRRVDKGDTRIDSSDARLLHVSLLPLPPGKYRVRWHVVAADTHRTNGDFSFTVVPAGAPHRHE